MSDTNTSEVNESTEESQVEETNEEAVETEESTEQAGEGEVKEKEEAKTEDNKSKDTTKDKLQAKATKEEKKIEAKLKKLKLKIDGEEVEEALPFEISNDPKVVEYMTRQLQLAKMGQKRAQYASNLEKEITQFFNDLKTNPREVLSDPNISVDLKKLAADILNDAAEEAKKTPEQKEKEKIEAELKKLRAEREKEQEENKKKEFERLQEQEYRRYEQDIIKALDTSDLPKSPYVVRKMADYLLTGLEAGKNLTAEDVLPLVKEEIHNDIKQMFAASPDEVMEQFLGKDRLSNYRKKTVAKAKTVPASPKAKDVAKPDEQKAEKKLSYRQFFDA